MNRCSRCWTRPSGTSRRWTWRPCASCPVARSAISLQLQLFILHPKLHSSVCLPAPPLLPSTSVLLHNFASFHTSPVVRWVASKLQNLNASFRTPNPPFHVCHPSQAAHHSAFYPRLLPSQQRAPIYRPCFPCHPTIPLFCIPSPKYPTLISPPPTPNPAFLGLHSWGP